MVGNEEEGDSMFDNYIKWIEAHERLLLVAVAGVVLYFGVSRVDTLIVHHDAALLSQAQVVAKTQQDKNEAIAAQVARDKASFDDLNAQVQARDAQLVQLQAQLVTTLAQRQKTDATLPPTELVQRLNTLVPTAQATVTPTGIALPETGAVATVQALEELPVLRTQNEYERTQIANTEKLVTAEGVQVTTLNAQVDGLKLQLTDDAKVCKAEVATVKATARRSKRKWFYAGMVVGFIGRQLIKSETGF